MIGAKVRQTVFPALAVCAVVAAPVRGQCAAEIEDAPGGTAILLATEEREEASFWFLRWTGNGFTLDRFTRTRTWGYYRLAQGDIEAVAC